MTRPKSGSPNSAPAKTSAEPTARANRVKKFLANARGVWTTLLQAAAWICSVVAGFLLPPTFVGLVSGRLLTTENLYKLAQFIVAVLLGVAFAGAVRSRCLRSVRAWGLVTVGALVLAVTVFFVYLSAEGSWTCTYASTPVVIGSEFTAHGARYVEGRGRGHTCDFWIRDHLGDVTGLWTRGSILRREIVLLVTYIVTVPLFALCLMGAIQTVTESVRSK